MSRIGEIFCNGCLQGRRGRIERACDALSGKSYIMIYFSAHWCRSCRAFTPQLVARYKANADERNVEVVFVSSDKNRDSFDEFFRQMPWLAVPYADRGIREELTERFRVRDVPKLVVLDGEGNLVAKDGCDRIHEYLGEGGYDMVRMSTSKMMKTSKQNGPYQLVGTLCCLPLVCIWYPWLFLAAAANVTAECDTPGFVSWLRVFGTVPMALFMVIQTFLVLAACLGCGRCYKIGLRAHSLTGVATAALVIWGWVLFTRTSERCDGDGSIKPRILALVFLSLNSICLPCVVLWLLQGCFGDVHRQELLAVSSSESGEEDNDEDSSDSDMAVSAAAFVHEPMPHH